MAKKEKAPKINKNVKEYIDEKLALKEDKYQIPTEFSPEMHVRVTPSIIACSVFKILTGKLPTPEQEAEMLQQLEELFTNKVILP